MKYLQLIIESHSLSNMKTFVLLLTTVCLASSKYVLVKTVDENPHESEGGHDYHKEAGSDYSDDYSEDLGKGVFY